MIGTFEPNGEPTPETCAAVLAEYLRMAAIQVGAVDFGVIHAQLLVSLQVSEEEIGAEITTAHFTLCRSGLLVSSTPGCLTGGTKVSASPALQRYIWAASSLWHNEEADE